MLYAGQPCSFGFTYDNWGSTPSSTPGTSVTAGASNAEGSWTQIASSANIAQDIYYFDVNAGGGFVSTVAKNQLLDIGVDPAGGTSYTAIISNLIIGSITTTAGLYARFSFPFFIKAGSSVAARVQGSHTTGGTVRVCAKFYGQPSAPEAFPVGATAETLGTITNSNGTSFTPGNGAWGSWASLGSLTTPAWYWNLGVQIDNGTMSGHSTYVQLGVGDGTNMKVILQKLIASSTTEAITHADPGMMAGPACVYPAPAGATAYVRGWNSAAPVTGYNATAIAIGG